MQIDGVFNVRDFGARGVESDDTESIQAALNAARDAGGGMVLFPAGHYLVKPDPKLRARGFSRTRLVAPLKVYSGTNLVGISRNVSRITAEGGLGLFVLENNAANFSFRSLLLETKGGSVWQSPGGCSKGTVDDVFASATGSDSAIWYQEHRRYAPQSDEAGGIAGLGVKNPGWVQMRILNSEFSSYGECKTIPAWYIATSGGLNGNLFSHCRFNDNPTSVTQYPKNRGTRQYAIHLERCHPSAHAFDNAFRDLIFERTTGGEIRLLSGKNCVIENCHGYDYHHNGYDPELSEVDGVDTGRRYIFQHIIFIGCGAYLEDALPKPLRKPGLVSENISVSNSGRRSSAGKVDLAPQICDMYLMDAVATVLENINTTPRDSLIIDVGQSATTTVRNVHKNSRILGRCSELKRSGGSSKWRCDSPSLVDDSDT